MSRSADDRTATKLIAEEVLDSQLMALLWLLQEGGVPIVVALRTNEPEADEIRNALAGLVGQGHVTADGALAGGVVRAGSLEEVLRLARPVPAADVPDEARDLGVVVVVDSQADSGPLRVSAAHYVRPVERDAAGHIQRRPPALLSALSEGGAKLDHFFWAITDELATRVGWDPEAFDDAYRRRSRVLRDLVAARVFERDELRHQLEHASLGHAAPRAASGADAPN